MTVEVAPGAVEGSHPLPVTLAGGGAASSVTRIDEIRIDDEPAGFGPLEGSFEAGAFDSGGNEYVQAGGRPFEATAEFEMNMEFNDPAEGAEWFESVQPAGVKDVFVDLPPGFVGDPTAVPQCSNAELADSAECPIASQVGVATYEQYALPALQMVPVYNVVPDNGAPAMFVFPTPTAPVVMTPVLRSDGDWGLSIKVEDIPEGNPVFSTSVTLWGNPADPAHDPLRCAQPNHIAEACTGSNALGAAQTDGSADPVPSPVDDAAFLANPTECSGDPEVIGLHMDAWRSPAAREADGDPDLSDAGWVSESYEAPALTGCDALGFEPSVGAHPTTRRPESPSGLRFELKVPQNDDPDGVATAHLRDTTVVLPSGVSVNPSSADGLEACSSEEIGLVSKSPVRFTKLEPDCPLASKIGNVVVDTPLLEDPMGGEVFLAAQGDNPFDSPLAFYMVLRGPNMLGKLAAHVEAGAETGRLTTTVAENPQLPFDKLTLRLKEGPRAPLATPAVCGTHTTHANLTSWAGHDVDLESSFDVSGNCSDSLADRPFEPGFAAGTTNPVAGQDSPFVLRLTRPDGDQEIDRLRMEMPEGLTANLSGIPYCSEAQIEAAEARDGRAEKADPSCPAASEVGETLTGAGAGSSPIYVGGKVYLAGAYKGAPLSLAIVNPALAGPFDLGTVVVRTALHVNPRTAKVTAISDPIPKVLNVDGNGFPLRVRDIRVKLDRQGFTLNPTNCSEMAVTGKVNGSHGASSDVSSRFQVGDCAALGFQPRFGMMNLGKGRRSTLRSFNPPMRFVVAPRPGDANISRAAVTLPRSIILDQSNIGTTCTRDQLASRECPDRSLMGFARAWSPQLDRPVQGPVYLGSSDNLLPDLVADLQGQVDVLLRGRIDSARGGRIRNTFSVVPDVSVSRFALQMAGGPNRGILVNSTDLCRSDNRGVSVFGAHNGRRQVARPPVRLSFRGCRKVRRMEIRRQKIRQMKLRRAVQADRITPAQARRLLRR